MLRDIAPIITRLLEVFETGQITLPSMGEVQISHYYGIDNFFEFGCILVPVVNQEYCKKYIVLFEGQNSPTHYHLTKKETFFLLSGQLKLCVDGIPNILSKGDLSTIQAKQKHTFSALTDCVIEELSTHSTGIESIYLDSEINNNTKRKTILLYKNGISSLALV